MGSALSRDELRAIDAYWRAANYLSVGQIYLLDNPLLRQPLTREHVKPRLLGHWGTTPGLNFIYVHLNRAIKRYNTWLRRDFAREWVEGIGVRDAPPPSAASIKLPGSLRRHNPL